MRRCTRQLLAAGSLAAGSLLAAAALAFVPPRFVTEWGPHGSGPGEFLFPVDIALAPDGSLLITDTRNRRIQVWDQQGHYLRSWDVAGTPVSDGGPNGVIIAPNGDVYIVDGGTYSVHRYRIDGTFLGQWGAQGTEPGEFLGLRAVVADAQSNIYVSDPTASNIQKFSPTGQLIARWENGENGALFGAPMGMAIAGDNLFVTDLALQHVQQLTLNGVLVRRWGEPGRGPGQLLTPLDVAIDASGDAFVVDHHNFRIQQFTSTGTYVGMWGQQGSDPGELQDPHSILLTPEREMFITDFGNHGYIQHYSFTVAVDRTTWTQAKARYRPVATKP